MKGWRSKARALLRRMVEKGAGVFYEGPDMPPRIADEARLFLLQNPAATALDWEAFALALARRAWLDAWTRGFEHELRTRAEPLLQLVHPDEQATRDASFREAAKLREMLDGEADGDPLRGVPLADRAAAMARLGEWLGTHRVIVVRPDPEHDPER